MYKMPRKVTKRIARKVRRVRRRVSKRNTNMIGGPNTAKVTETYDLGPLNLNTGYIFNKAGITPGFRAAQVAPQFGLYRIAKLTWTFKPFYDTYTPNLGQAGGGQVGNQPDAVPYLYWKMNRYGDAPAQIDGTYLKEQGARAHRVDDKIITWSYRPNILLADAAAAGGGSGQVKMTPWLSTDTAPGDQVFNLSQTKHYGHTMVIEGAASGNALPPIGTYELKVVYEFKNPRAQRSSSSMGAQEVKSV